MAWNLGTSNDRAGVLGEIIDSLCWSGELKEILALIRKTATNRSGDGRYKQRMLLILLRGD